MAKTAQEWLNTAYSDKTVSEIKLYAKENPVEELTGELLIKGYNKVKKIDFERWDKKIKDKITKVTIDDCSQVEQIKFNNNEITEIIFQGDFPNLNWLDLPDNKLVKINVSKLPNLIRLNIARNPNFAEIEGWENLTKLEVVNLFDTPGINGKKFKEWKDAINSALGTTSPDGNLPDDWKNTLNDLKNRPTKDDLNNAVKAEGDKYKDYINPKDEKDKDKLKEAAKNAGFVDPNDKSAFETAAKNNGMVPKADLDTANTKIKDYENNLKEKLDLNDGNLNTWKEAIDKLKSGPGSAEQINQIKEVLGLKPNESLPADWKDKLVPKSELDKWKVLGKTPEDVQKEINDLKSKVTAGGSGTGGTLTPEQQKKIDYYYVIASYLRRFKGNDWNTFIDKWKEDNKSYIESSKQYFAQIEQAGKK